MLARLDGPRDILQNWKAAAHDRELTELEDGFRAGHGHEQIAADQRYRCMSNERKQDDGKFKPTEKETMDEPQEEFVADQSVPSRDIHEVQEHEVADIHEGREKIPDLEEEQ